MGVAFKLVPPRINPFFSLDVSEMRWHVEFAIQSIDEAHRSLSAAEIWKGELGFLRHSEYTQDDLESILLKGLGKASSFFPELEDTLDQPHPTEVVISTPEAYSFLRETAEILREAGFSVSLPNWWKNPKLIPGLELSVSLPKAEGLSKSQNSLGLYQLLDYSWKNSLGERSLSPEEFKHLVEQESLLIPVGEEWVSLQPEKLKNTLEFLEEESKKPKLQLLEALRFGLGAKKGSNTLPIVSFKTEGWLENLINYTNDASSENVATPGGFSGDLRPYQSEGLKWLSLLSRAGLGACLADDMGLGKLCSCWLCC